MPDLPVRAARPSRTARPSLTTRVRRLVAVVAAATLLTTVPVSGAQADTGHWPRKPGNRYVAMGDSFSSGEGLFRYLPGTDTASNSCHRSPLAYGPLLSYVLPRARSLSFVACSGAATVDLYQRNHLYESEPKQLAALGPGTRTVTMTLGGNDIGFAQVLAACIRPRALSQSRCSDDPRVTGTVGAGLSALAGQTQLPPVVPMTKVLTDIAAAFPHATIYVGAYPELFGDDPADFAADAVTPSGRSCTLLDSGVPATTAVLDYADAQFFNESTKRLNTVLSTAVDQVRANGVRAEFVPVPIFAGHGLCDAKRAWLNPVIPDTNGLPAPESIHPNLWGSLGYTESFWRALSGRRALPAAVRQHADAVSSAAPGSR